MGLPMTVDSYIELVYGPQETPEMLKSKRNTVSRMCRDGVLDASKSGRRWLIWLEEKSDAALGRTAAASGVTIKGGVT